MVVDRCDMLNVDSMTDTISDRSPCQVSDKTPGENFFLNVNTLLQLGGRYVEPSFPQTVTSDRFKGCVRNLVHNGQVKYKRICDCNIILNTYTLYRHLE